MSSHEFTHWIAYYNLHPFGVERDNAHAGLIASMIGNAHRGKHGKPFNPSDFMFQSDRERLHRGTQEFIARLKANAKPKQEK